MAKKKSTFTNWQRLLALLYRIEFPQRYDALCLKYPKRNESWQSEAQPRMQGTLQEALATTGLKFRYYRGEDFHRYHRKDDPRCDIKFHVSTIGVVAVELSLYVQFRGEHVLGGHFAALADAAIEAGAPRQRLKPSPTQLHFNGSEELLRAAVQDGVELFRSVEEAILAESDWQVEET